MKCLAVLRLCESVVKVEQGLPVVHRSKAVVPFTLRRMTSARSTCLPIDHAVRHEAGKQDGPSSKICQAAVGLIAFLSEALGRSDFLFGASLVNPPVLRSSERSFRRNRAIAGRMFVHVKIVRNLFTDGVFKRLCVFQFTYIRNYTNYILIYHSWSPKIRISDSFRLMNWPQLWITCRLGPSWCLLADIFCQTHSHKNWAAALPLSGVIL